MSLDLNDLLRDWPHEPGQIKVRKIMGSDGREKVQLRIDLGLIQMEVDGRPDGRRPHGHESLLKWHQTRAREQEAMGGAYTLDAEDVGELQQEGIQYYHRYIALFQLGEYANVVRDTRRNLDLFDFVADHAANDEMAGALEVFRPYVLMMNTRARASIELERENLPDALKLIERGREEIVDVIMQMKNPDMLAQSPELQFLDEWLNELRAKQPLSKLEKLQREMERAIASEAYERAAELRDAIRAHDRKQSH